MTSAVPLMLIPLALYNLAMVGGMGGGGVAALQRDVAAFPMVSGALWTLLVGDILILIALVLLFIAILKAARGGSRSTLGHILSLLVFVVFVAKFLLVQGAATQIFFILMAIALVDAVGVTVVAVQAAERNMSIGL